MTSFDPVSLLDDDAAILRYPSALLESLRDGWSSAVPMLYDVRVELVAAAPSELGGLLSRFDELGQGLVDARLFDGSHPLYAGRPQSVAGRLRFLGDVVLGLLARSYARRVGSELTALSVTIDRLAAETSIDSASVGRLRGPRAVEYLAASWPFQVRSFTYYDGCVPPYDNLPSAPPPLPPPPLPLWTTPPPPLSAPPPIPPSDRGSWTLSTFPSAYTPEGEEGPEGLGNEPGGGAPEREDDDDARDETAPDDAARDQTPAPTRFPVAVPSGLGSLVTEARALDPIDDEPLPELASRVTIPLFEREFVRLCGEISLLVYEAGRIFGARDRTPRLLARELRRLEVPAIVDALLGDGARGMRVDRALMRLVANAQDLIEEWRVHAEGEGELLEVEVRALRMALEERALLLCQSTLAAGSAVGVTEDDWTDYWAGLAEDADDERMVHDG